MQLKKLSKVPAPYTISVNPHRRKEIGASLLKLLNAMML